MIKCAVAIRTENKLAQTITDQRNLSINQSHVYFSESSLGLLFKKATCTGCYVYIPSV